MTAIHDGVALANWISTLHKPELADIEAIFAEYQAERLPVAKDAVAASKLFKNMGGKVNTTNKNRSVPLIAIMLLFSMEYAL